MEIHINQNNPSFVTDIYFSEKVGGFRVVHYYEGDVHNTETLNEGAAYPKPSLRLPTEVFKDLVDEIHRNHKPSEGKFNEGKLEAMGRHLEDMRKLVFKGK